MTETQEIIDAWRRARAERVRAAIATVVRVDGSAYRRPGARMVITEGGDTTGIVSGGCLDADVRERASRVMQTGQPVVAKYDSTTADNVVWGLGLGCDGIVQVLIEPDCHRADQLVRFLETCSTSHSRAACATVIRTERPELPIGARMFLHPDGRAEPDAGVLDDGFAQHAIADLQAAVLNGVSSVTRYGDESQVEAFIEVLERPVPLVIFGAGADVLPLVTMARQLGWHTTVVDTRARAASLDRFSRADAVILCRPEEVNARVVLNESSVVLLMTHHYLHDFELLQTLANSSARYIGCLGSRRRIERLWSDLTPQQIHAGRLHAPVGLDLGAETSSEIALSIAAEILSVLRHRSGGPLRDCQGAIHARHMRTRDSRRRRIPADGSPETAVAVRGPDAASSCR